ncbi:hypothetical protein [Leucobacter chironomi]|uniref:hypothetical protein n=1 Tax=Leucobacter chironomi TaxID=491918 RepID=UPI00040CE50C|nr:hypothetical protein [Leucobacter chironomi]
MKTAISIPDRDFDRFEQVAARHGMNRSEFYRSAAQWYADVLEGSSDLTAIANAVLERTGQPTDTPFADEVARNMLRGTEW